MLDHEQCYRAVASRDARFDGWFVAAVRTTGIYCRPSCPAVTPKRANVEFFPTAAAAQEHGYRACKRCRPDASPGLAGVGRPRRRRRPGDAPHRRRRRRPRGRRRPRPPAALQRAPPQPPDHRRARRRAARHRPRPAGDDRPRAHRDDVDAVHGDRLRRRVRQRAPVQRHRAGGVRGVAVATAGCAAATVRRTAGGQRAPVPSPSTSPCASRSTSARRWRSSRPGRSRRRALRRRPRTTARWRCRTATASPPSTATPVVKGGRTHVRVTFRLADWRDLAPAVRRVRRLLDLDADPVAVDAALGSDPVLGAARRPARPGCACRAASTRSRPPCAPSSASRSRSPAPAPSPGASSRAVGDAADASPTTTLTHVFPSPGRARRRSTQRCCRCRCAAGATLIELGRAGRRSARSSLDAGADRDDVRARPARRARHRPVDRRLRADARARRSRRVPRRRPRRQAGLDRARHRRRRRRALAAVALVRRAPPVGKDRPCQCKQSSRTTIDSPIGTITLVADDDALVEVHLPERARRRRRPRPRTSTPGRSRGARQAAAELDEYFAGDRVEFDVPLAPHGTPFQLAAWQALRTIPYGETVSYGEQARRLGDPQGPGRRRRQRPQPAADRRAVPPRGRRQRPPHRLRRRHRVQGLAARPRARGPPANAEPCGR